MDGGLGGFDFSKLSGKESSKSGGHWVNWRSFFFSGHGYVDLDFVNLPSVMPLSEIFI